MAFDARFQALLNDNAEVRELAGNLFSAMPEDLVDTQDQTRQAFSDKWSLYDYSTDNYRKMVEHQKGWYLELYGFKDEAELKAYLEKCPVILDAGAGKCYKAAWFAELSPESTVVAADISTSLPDAAKNFEHLKNLFFVNCDIGQMPFFKEQSFAYVSCDQVIHHTAKPYQTFLELLRITQAEREVSTYVYRRKGLPRELLDDHFRDYSRELSHDQLMELSEQMTVLGKLLSQNEEELYFPAIPALDIEAGKMTVQRWIYWNLMKCYWNPDQGERNSTMINYDWYSPSQATRYSEEEFREWITKNDLSETHFHREEACYSGRFRK